MVDIRFPLPRGNSCRIKVAGHTGSGPKGFDLVCSALSAMVLTMLGGLENEMGAEVEGQLENGICDVVIKVQETDGDRLGQVLKIFRYGFKRLAQSYPEFVKFHS